MLCFFPLINVELHEQKADIFYDSDKLVIARLARTILSIFFSFLLLYCHFTRLKPREISQQKIKNSENIVLETLR